MRAARVFLVVAILAGLLPLLGANVAYLLSASAGNVPGCNPYLTGCTSISATGRLPPGSFVYKGTMMPAAVFMLAYWYLAGRWLATHGDNTRRCRALPWLGLVASVFLIFYTTVLGHVGEWYAIQRRIGVVGYLSATFFGQLLLVSRMADLLANGEIKVPAWVYRSKLVLCAGMLLLGLALVFAPLLIKDMTTVERIIEWDFSVLMVLFFPLTAVAWAHDGFGADFRVRN